MSFGPLRKVRGLGASRSSLAVFAAAAGLILLKLWLVSAQPVIAIGWASHDDRLFLNLARNLLDGTWLGPFNELTLAKGCFYPIWIALIARLGIPLLLSQHLLYLLAVLALVGAVRPLGYGPWRVLLLGAVLWFNPGTYTAQVLRVMRAGIYPALTLLVIAGFVGTLLRARAGSWRAVGPWVLLSALSLSAFWQTREEGVWLLPFVAGVIAFVFARQWWIRAPGGWSLGLSCVIPLLAIPCSDGIVALINKAHYGIAVTVEFKSHDFLAAYGALTRVKPKELVPHVQVSKEMRELIYPVSPAFATLKPRLDGPVAHSWSAGEGGEIPGGSFVWAFRQAVARAGYYASGRKAMAFYRRLAGEVDSACKAGKLDCLPARASMMPPWVPGYGPAVLKAFVTAARFTAGFAGMSAEPAFSVGNDSTQALYRKLTHDRIAPLGTLSDVRVAGWILGKDSMPTVTVVDAVGATVDAPIEWLASPDVQKELQAKHLDLPQADRARFDIVVPSGASLRIRAGAGSVRSIPLDGTVRSVAGPDLYFHLDVVAPTQAQTRASKRAAEKVRLLNGALGLYRAVMPVLAVLALLAFVIQTVEAIRRRRIPEILVVQAGLLGALLARLAILSVIDVTSFPAVDPLYLTAAYPVLILFVFLALYERERMVSRRGPWWKGIFRLRGPAAPAAGGSSGT